MKSSKRYLLVALALLLAALLFTGVALAEGADPATNPVAKIEITKAETTDLNLYGGEGAEWKWSVGTGEGSQFLITLTGTDATTPATNVKLKIYSDNEAIGWVEDPGHIYGSDANTFVHANKEGAITLHVDAYGPSGVIASGTLPITFALVKEESIKFTNDMPYEFEVGQKYMWMNSLDITGPTVAGEPKQPTYGPWDVSWDSSKKDVAIIDKNGMLDALKAGTTTITATAKGDPTKTATVEVTIKPVEYHPYGINKLTLTQTTFELNKEMYENGLDLTRFLKIEDVNGFGHQVSKDDDDSIVVTSSDETVATVRYNRVGPADNYDEWTGDFEDLDDARYLPDWNYHYWIEHFDDFYRVHYRAYRYDHVVTVTPVGSGTTTITLTSKHNPSVKAECKISFDEEFATGIAFSETGFTVKEEKTIRLKNYMTVTPSQISLDDVVIKFVSSDTTVASVTKNGGVVTGKKVGTATITATIANNPEATPATVTINVTEKGIAPTKVTFSEAAITASWKDEDGIDLSDYYQLTPSDADRTEIIWSSSNLKVATVDNYGNVSAVKPGKATITAKNDKGEVLGSIEVNFIENPAKKITIAQDAFTVSKGESFSIIDKTGIVVNPSDSDDEFYWVSSDVQVAKVAYGTFTKDNIGQAKVEICGHDHADGTAVLTVYAKSNPEVKATITVTVVDKALESIAFTQEKIAYDLGQAENEYILSNLVKFTPEDASNKELVWQSSDPQIARVATVSTEDGVYTILAPIKTGTVEITATPKGLPSGAKKITVTINERKIADKITFAPEAVTTDLSDGSLYLPSYYQITPYDGVYTTIQWLSSDPSIACVDEESPNYLRLYKSGAVTLTANVIFRDKVVATGTFAVTITDKYAPTAITVSPAAVTLGILDELNLGNYYTISPIRARNYYIVWISSDPDVVYVDGESILASKKGTATLTANVIYNDAVVATGTLAVTVTELPTTAITFSPAELTVKLDGYHNLSAHYQITPLTATDNTKIYWTSDNPEVAYVVEDYFGLDDYVYGLSVGTANITATVVDENTDAILCTGTVKVNVKDIVLTGLAFQQAEYTAKLNSKVNVNIGWSYTPVNWDIDYSELEVLNSNTYVVDADIYDLDKDILSVTAKRPGTATVTLKSKTNDAIYATAKITVEAQPISSVSFRKNTLKLYYAETKNQRDMADIQHNGGVYQSVYDVSSLLQIQPTNAFVDDITWETSNSNVAFVYTKSSDSGSSSSYSLKGINLYGESAGTIIAVGTGKATISAIISDGVNTFKKDIDVIVLGKTISLKLNKSKVTMNLLKGEEVTYQLKAYDDDTDEEVPVKWKSNKTSVATVDANGVVTAVKAGKAVITATTKDGTKTIATCTITVKKNLIKKIKTVDGKKALTMSVGEVKELMNGDDALLVISPANAYNKALKYSSDKPKIVKVDKNGKMTAVGAGTAKITIKANDGSKKSLTLKVTVEKAEN